MQKNRFYKDKMSVRWHPISTTAYLLFIIIIDLRIMKDSNVKGNKYCDTSKVTFRERLQTTSIARQLGVGSKKLNRDAALLAHNMLKSVI